MKNFIQEKFNALQESSFATGARRILERTKESYKRDPVLLGVGTVVAASGVVLALATGVSVIFPAAVLGSQLFMAAGGFDFLHRNVRKPAAQAATMDMPETKTSALDAAAKPGKDFNRAVTPDAAPASPEAPATGVQTPAVKKEPRP